MTPTRTIAPTHTVSPRGGDDGVEIGGHGVLDG